MPNLPVISDAYIPSNVTKIGEKALSIIREKPVRRVFGGHSNVNVRFASSKMKCVIQAESRTVEYLFVLACEMDDEIIEYWDQPLRIKLSYLDIIGRKRGNLHTPDFCIITKDQVYLVECKTESQLIKLSQKNPEKFCKNEEGQWISPAGEAAAKEYGFGYKVYTPKSFSSVFARNCEFLIDYVSSDIPDELKDVTQKVKNLVESEKILNLKKLLSLINSPDAVYYAIAKKLITFDWFNDLVIRPEASYVYDSFVTKSVQKNSTFPSSPQSITLNPGNKFVWNKTIWTVLDINNVITAQDVNLNIVELKNDDVIKLINSGKISLSNSNQEHDNLLKSILMETSNAEFKIALSRLELVRNKKGDIPERTIRRWKKLFFDAENQCGIGLIGLLPKTKKRGNKSDRLTDTDLKHIAKSIEKDYEKSSPNSAYGAYANYKKSCTKKGLIAVSYKTYLNVIHNRDKYHLVKQRHGRKAAYQIKNQHQLPEACDNITNLPPQGDRAFEVAHIDHTQLEIELISSITGEPLGRPWLTTFVDSYSRVVLSYWLSFESPSSRSIMMTLRRCVERFNRLPQKIVLDRGAEFQSTYLEVLLASYYVTKIDRTASEPRDGSIVERYFLTTQTKFIHMLTGNTSNRRLERGLSKSHEPSDLAIWTPDDFEQKLEEWLYEVFPILPHRGLGDKPKNLFDRSLKESGQRSFRRILYNEAFYIATLPAVKGNTRKIHNGQVSISNLSYIGLSMALGPHNGKKVKVKIDPYNLKFSWIYLDNHWQKVICNHYLIREYDERNLKMVHMEVIARLSLTSKEYRNIPQKLLSFLDDLQAQEKLLMNKEHTLEAVPEQQELSIFQDEVIVTDEDVEEVSDFPFSYIPR